MPRGAMYDDGVPHSDNAIESGVDKAHGTNPGSDVDRSYKAAPIPEVRGTDDFHSGQGSRGYPLDGHGKSGHDPKTLGERKGMGAHKGTGFD